MEYRLHQVDKRSPVSSRVISGVGLCISLLVSTGVSATGQQVEITSGDCRTGVQLVARNAPLAEVLKRLSRALDFELRFEGDETRRVTVNATRPPAELVSSLSPQDSIIVTQAKDAKCPGRNRVVKVWVLPSTKESAMRDTPPMTPARAVQSSGESRPVVRELVIRGSSELEEQSQRAKAAYDDYVRTHGKPPPGVEEEAAKP
jgi:hypothetical protein